MTDAEELPINTEADIIAARSRAREHAKILGFGAIDQSRIATAVSELTRNVIRYATNSSGRVEIRDLTGDRTVSRRSWFRMTARVSMILTS